MFFVDTTQRDGKWVCYACGTHVAVELFRGDTLDDCRAYAKSVGCEGIIIGSPSLPWAN